MIEPRRFEIGGDLVLGHGQDLQRRNEMSRGGVRLERCFGVFQRHAVEPEANGTPRRPASRTAIVLRPSVPQCNK
jgi:hypothetical protein